MERIGGVLDKNWDEAAKPGNLLPFEVHITQDGLPLTLRGITAARALIGRVLKAIEGH